MKTPPEQALQLPPAEAVATQPPRAPSRAELQGEVSAFMEHFEAAERERERSEDAMHNQMDDDGYALA